MSSDFALYSHFAGFELLLSPDLSSSLRPLVSLCLRTEFFGFRSFWRLFAFPLLVFFWSAELWTDALVAVPACVHSMEPHGGHRQSPLSASVFAFLMKTVNRFLAFILVWPNHALTTLWLITPIHLSVSLSWARWEMPDLWWSFYSSASVPLTAPYHGGVITSQPGWQVRHNRSAWDEMQRRP